MATRPVFVPLGEGQQFVREVPVDFEWNPGFAPIQKRKNVAALHKAAAARGLGPLLEVSTKSACALGEHLSAFRLHVILASGTVTTLEAAFQGSKVFEAGGPYTDIFGKTSREAKRDERLKSSGRVTGFQFEGIAFPAEPKTSFYDWLYARTLLPHEEFLRALDQYAGFTDVEFNPGKSINCQARSCALFVALRQRGQLAYAVASVQNWLEVTAVNSFAQPYSRDVQQGRLL